MGRSISIPILILSIALVLSSVHVRGIRAQRPVGQAEAYFTIIEERAEGNGATPLNLEYFSGFFTEALIPDSPLMESCYGAVFRCGYFTGCRFRNGIGYGVNLGIGTASGKPAVRNPEWTIHSSELRLVNGFLGAMFMYSFMGDPLGRDFDPLLGIGVQCDVGGERIEAAGERSFGGELLEFEGHDWSIRNSFSVKFLLASRIRISERYRVVVGMEWTHGGAGRDKSLKFEEDAEDFERTLYDALRRSDYNFTGWSLIIAIEW